MNLGTAIHSVPVPFIRDQSSPVIKAWISRSRSRVASGAATKVSDVSRVSIKRQRRAFRSRAPTRMGLAGTNWWSKLEENVQVPLFAWLSGKERRQIVDQLIALHMMNGLDVSVVTEPQVVGRLVRPAVERMKIPKVLLDNIDKAGDPACKI